MKSCLIANDYMDERMEVVGEIIDSINNPVREARKILGIGSSNNASSNSLVSAGSFNSLNFKNSSNNLNTSKTHSSFFPLSTKHSNKKVSKKTSFLKPRMVRVENDLEDLKRRKNFLASFNIDGGD